MSASNYLQQLEQMGEMPDFRTELVKAYENPVLRPIVNEQASLEAQYLPSLFEPLAKMGNTGAHMSPEAKLAAITGSLNRLTARAGANQNIQNFYGMQIDNLAGQYNQKWGNKYKMLMDLYQLARERESAASQQSMWDNLFNQPNGATGNAAPEIDVRKREMHGKIRKDLGTQLGQAAGGIANVLRQPIGLNTGTLLKGALAFPLVPAQGFLENASKLINLQKNPMSVNDPVKVSQLAKRSLPKR